MMKKVCAIIIVAFVATVLWSCEKVVSYDSIPSVEFTSVYLADTVDGLGNDVKMQRLTLFVTDGDGNLGLNESDTTGNYATDSYYYHNLFIVLSQKRSNGTYDEIQNLSNSLRYRIPYNKPVGQNKYLEASIKVKIEIPTAYFDYDTVRYEIVVYDRDLNCSQTALSCDVPARIHGTVFADGSVSIIEDEPEEEEE